MFITFKVSLSKFSFYSSTVFPEEQVSDLRLPPTPKLSNDINFQVNLSKFVNGAFPHQVLG